MLEIKVVKFVRLPGAPLSAEEIVIVEQRMLNALRRGAIAYADQIAAREIAGATPAPGRNISFIPEA